MLNDANEPNERMKANHSLGSVAAVPPPSPEPWLDVELEARLHFGAREMLLSEAFSLAPGVVLELDRSVSDPVDLLIGDRIMARGEVVVVDGNFALQISEVLEPQLRLESVRCLL